MGTLARENFSDPDFPFRFKLERTASSESPKLELKNKEGERKGGGKKKERKRRKSHWKKDTGDSLVGARADVNRPARLWAACATVCQPSN